jgi:trehalose 6-phosphate synthase/phosphatase
VGGVATALLPVLEGHGGVWVAMGEREDLPVRQPYPADDPLFTVRRVPLKTPRVSRSAAVSAKQPT